MNFTLSNEHIEECTFCLHTLCMSLCTKTTQNNAPFVCLHCRAQLVAWHDTLKSELGVVDSSSHLSGRTSLNDNDSENYFASNSGFDIGHFVPPSILPSVKRMCIDLYVLGVRDLQSNGVIPITKSLLEVEVTNDRRSAKVILSYRTLPYRVVSYLKVADVTAPFRI